MRLQRLAIVVTTAVVGHVDRFVKKKIGLMRDVNVLSRVRVTMSREGGLLMLMKEAAANGKERPMEGQ